jgi:hypothetical protein
LVTTQHLPLKLEDKEIIYCFLIRLEPSFYPENLCIVAEDLEENSPGSHLKVNIQHEGSKFSLIFKNALKRERGKKSIMRTCCFKLQPGGKPGCKGEGGALFTSSVPG